MEAKICLQYWPRKWVGTITNGKKLPSQKQCSNYSLNSFWCHSSSNPFGKTSTKYDDWLCSQALKIKLITFVNIVLFSVLPRFYGYKSCFTFYSWAFESSIDHNLLYLESNVPTTYDPIATMRSDTLKILATTTTATAAATTAAAATTTAWNACNNSTQQQASLSIGLFAKILILELPKLHVDHVSRSTLGNHPETRSVP